MTHVAAYTGDARDPSSRFRIRQFVQPLDAYGIKVLDFPNVHGRYPPPKTLGRAVWLPQAIARAAWNVVDGRDASVSWLQREFVSTIETTERFTTRPRILDIDDAIFLDQRFRSLDRIARSCELISCGNDYLADYFERLSNVVVLPTVVDTTRYEPPAAPRANDTVTIGWMGTASNLDALLSISEALAYVLKQRSNVRLRVVTDANSLPTKLQGERVELIRWSEESEVRELQSFDIGLMPLLDTAWSRGKCGYKLLTYAAAGATPVASPVGVNLQILDRWGDLLPDTLAHWEAALLGLVDDRDLRVSSSESIRRRIVDHYSVESLVPQLAETLQAVASGSAP